MPMTQRRLGRSLALPVANTLPVRSVGSLESTHGGSPWIPAGRLTRCALPRYHRHDPSRWISTNCCRGNRLACIGVADSCRAICRVAYNGIEQTLVARVLLEFHI